MNDGRALPEGKTVIFLHVPKCGGLTLYDILNREYGRSRIFTFKGGRHRLEQDIDQFKTFSAEKRNTYRLLRGHIPFGIHDLINKPFTYFTLLREPVSRVVSHYHYVKNNPNHLLHEAVTVEQMSLETYVSSGVNYEMDNGQTRQIAGITDEIPYGECTEALLKQAKENLTQSFSVVGLTERFDETLLLLKQVLGWQKYPFYTRQNVSKSSKSDSFLSNETRQLISKYNQLDLELYAFVKQTFAKQLEQLPQQEIGKFQRYNRLYAPFGRLSSASRQGLRRLRQASP